MTTISKPEHWDVIENPLAYTATEEINAYRKALVRKAVKLLLAGPIIFLAWAVVAGIAEQVFAFNGSSSTNYRGDAVLFMTCLIVGLPSYGAYILLTLKARIQDKARGPLFQKYPETWQYFELQAAIRAQKRSNLYKTISVWIIVITVLISIAAIAIALLA